MWRRRPPNELTPREREVFELVRRGLTNEEIAERLHISVAGAKYHVSQILSKLGVATREEAASLALDYRRRWWAGWPLWASIGGAATVAATGAMVAIASTVAIRLGTRKLSLCPPTPRATVEGGTSPRRGRAQCGTAVSQPGRR